MMFDSTIHIREADKAAEKLGRRWFHCRVYKCKWNAKLERLTGAENAGDEGKWSVRYPNGRGALNHNHSTQRPRRPRLGHMVGLVKKYKIADDLWELTPLRRNSKVHQPSLFRCQTRLRLPESWCSPTQATTPFEIARRQRTPPIRRRRRK